MRAQPLRPFQIKPTVPPSLGSGTRGRFSKAALCLLAAPLTFMASLGQLMALSAEDVQRAAAGADIVLLGEIHDNPEHHLLQADVIAAIAPGAVVFEMLDSDEAARVTPERARDMDVLREVLEWETSGWPDFDLYAPIFAALGDAAVFGAEVLRDEAQRAFGEGAAGVFGAGAERFGLDAPLPEAQQNAREAAQLAAHCDALPGDLLPGFVEAQRLRDARLAEAALAALEAHGAPVVIITGNGHARRDWGVPVLLAIAAPDLEVFALGQQEATPDGAPPFDLVAVSDPIPRPDPCDAFR